MKKSLLQPSSLQLADYEYVAEHSLFFFADMLNLFSKNLYELRNGLDSTILHRKGSGGVIAVLSGTYLAQIIQSCLQLTKHR